MSIGAEQVKIIHLGLKFQNIIYIHICVCVRLHYAICFITLLTSFQVTLFNRVILSPKKMSPPPHPLCLLKNPLGPQKFRNKGAFQFTK